MQNAQKDVFLPSPHLHWLTLQFPSLHCAWWRKVPISQAFSLAFPVIQRIFMLLENLKWQPKQGIMLESALQTTSNACIYCRATNCSAGPHKGMDLGRAGFREHVPSQNAIPSHAANRFFPKYNAKPVTAKYSISLRLYVGFVGVVLRIRTYVWLENVRSNQWLKTSQV